MNQTSPSIHDLHCLHPIRQEAGEASQRDSSGRLRTAKKQRIEGSERAGANLTRLGTFCSLVLCSSNLRLRAGSKRQASPAFQKALQRIPRPPGSQSNRQPQPIIGQANFRGQPLLDRSVIDGMREVRQVVEGRPDRVGLDTGLLDRHMGWMGCLCQQR